MTPRDDLDLRQWTGDWQAAPQGNSSAEEIRRYVSRRSGLLWSFAVADFMIAGVALPLLAYLGWVTESAVQRLAMVSLAGVVIAAVAFGWWNRRGVLRASATSVAEFVAISEERLRRMRIALRFGWVVLAAEVIVFIVWIRDRLYGGGQAPDAAAERFAWTWLIGMSAAAAICLALFGRWIRRDAARFAALRRELTRDYPPH